MALRIDDVKPFHGASAWSRARGAWRVCAELGMRLVSRMRRIAPRRPIRRRRPTLFIGTPYRSMRHNPHAVTRPHPSRIDFVLAPLNAQDLISLRVDYTRYSQDRLLAIADATERQDIRRQAQELFRIVIGWDVEITPGTIAPLNRKTLAQLPPGTALVFAMEVAKAHAAGVKERMQPIESAAVATNFTSDEERRAPDRHLRPLTAR